MKHLLVSLSENRSKSGFTLTETLTCLLVVITLISIAGAAGSLTRTPSNQARCLNNLRTLTVAWSVYADENEGRLVGVGTSRNSRPDWVGPFNYISVIDPEVHLGRSPLLPYLNLHMDQRSAFQLFRCPADPSLTADSDYNHGRQTPRARSYSMNAWMGGADGGFSRFNWIQFENRSQFSSLPPSQAMVFIGERADSINDSALYISMNGYQDSTTLSDLSLLVDYPAFYHGGGASVSFADGHAIRKIWQDPRTIPAYSPERRLQLNNPSPQNPDVLWIQDHATRRF